MLTCGRRHKMKMVAPMPRQCCDWGDLQPGGTKDLHSRKDYETKDYEEEDYEGKDYREKGLRRKKNLEDKCCLNMSLPGSGRFKRAGRRLHFVSMPDTLSSGPLSPSRMSWRTIPVFPSSSTRSSTAHYQICWLPERPGVVTKAGCFR